MGFVGWPNEKALKSFGKARLIDLDNFFPETPSVGADVVPQNTCAIIKRIVSNGIYMKLDAIVVDDGPGKCDAARMAAYMLESLAKAPVILAPNKNRKSRGTPICDSTLPAKEKAIRILDGLTMPIKTDDAHFEPNPPAAIWGVPCADLSLYDLFPPGTRFLGWFRCLENRTPALEELELEIDPNTPTVYFAQTFCHKNILARHLATKYRGLYVDVDGAVTSSVRAKIEAFLKFNAKIKGRR